MFHHLTWLFSDTENVRELGLDIISKSWNLDYKENNSMCAEMILELQENEELDKTSAGTFIRLLCY